MPSKSEPSESRGRKSKWPEGRDCISLIFGRRQGCQIDAARKLILVKAYRAGNRCLTRTEFAREGMRVLTLQLKEGVYQAEKERPYEQPVVEVSRWPEEEQEP